MNSDKTGSILVCGAGLLGALGVALAAIAAHRVDDPRLATAANFLILHASASVAIVALSRGREKPSLLLAVAGLMLAGVALFSGSVASTVFTGEPLFPMSAPLGGSTLIGAWVLLAVAGLLSAFGKSAR